MKYIIILILTITVLLCGCRQSDLYPSTVPPAVDPTQAAEVSTTVPTEPPTEPATEPTEPPTEETKDPLGILGQPRPEPSTNYQEVYVFPYTQEDLDSAADTIMGWVEEYKKEEHVLYYEVDEILFNPVGLHQRISVYESMGPSEGQTMEENYQCWLLVEVVRTAHYDQTLSPNSCRSHSPAQFILHRDGPDAPWQYYSHSDSSLAPGYRQMLTAEELAALEFTDERILAGYFEEGGIDIYNQQLYPYEYDTYFLYVVDEETNTVVCREYPAE